MRAWIVGNGRSLAQTPLDMLVGETTFATNRIHLIFNKTTWRPTYYVRGENAYYTRALLEQDLKAIFQVGPVSYLNRSYEGVWRRMMKYEATSSRVEWLPDACEHTLMHATGKDEIPARWHDPLCSFAGSLFIAMQIAVKLGYNPLILVGCDLGYQDGQPSHFDPTYEQGFEDKLKPADLANADCLAAHRIAARSSTVRIYNATIGGNLEIYPRVSFEKAVTGEYEIIRGLDDAVFTEPIIEAPKLRKPRTKNVRH